VDYWRFDNFRLLGVCALCLLSAACIHEERPDHTVADKLPLGQVLEPGPDAPIIGPFAFRGWALSENGIEQVAIYEDRSYLASAKLGLSSPEAQKAQPDFPGSATAGWRFDADPSIFTSGRHELTVQARSKTGAIRELASWTVVIGTPFGKVDSPVDGAQLAGAFPIRGWTVSEHGVEQVNILVDGKFLGNPRMGLERKDVKGAFPKAKDSLNSGWNFEATTAMFTPGSHEIVVQARSKAGAVHEQGRVKVNIR
jgi:N-acetylmuramoyl-L-alanine amidase